MSETPLGRFCWYELLTTDLEGAQDFYRRIVGWETGAWQGEGPEYITWNNNGTPIGGVMQLPAEALADGAPAHWMPYVSTPDVDATVARAERLGGGTIHRMEIPEVGHIAVLRDPGGAVFTAYQPSGDTPGHDGPPSLGEFSWHELIAGDLEAAWSFYADLFGWEKTTQMDMGEAGIYQMYGRDGKELGGMMNRSDDMPPPCWGLYILVSDVHASAELVKELGGSVVVGPMEVPGGEFILQGIDPQGAAFALHSR
ncbi:MAG: VOC family protein [Gemmatimonadales bacterium]|nr:VOC family protein [Gemmatimonadales bacterium]MYG47859.1 VOC family protein [Gemmatimonadales bacterium]MYK01290.1 VOC family protein [Candidatus Palauibacter ramosifaciens]